MGLKAFRIYRDAKVGEDVQCGETGDIWEVLLVTEDGSVIVDEHFDMLTGIYSFTALDAYCYWIVRKAFKKNRKNKHL